MGWLNDDQPHLVGGWVTLSQDGVDQAGAALVLAQFPRGERIRFPVATPFRLLVIAWTELSRG